MTTIQDEALAGQVVNAIGQDKRIGGQAIAVRVVQGEVLLKGLVETHDQRDLALTLVLGVPGVRHVNLDELRVKEASE